MILKTILIFVLINETKCQAHLQKNTLNTMLEQTTKFFEKLQSNDRGILTTIDEKLMEYVSNTSKRISIRHKRESSEDFTKGINILKGFQDFTQLNFSNAQDVNFFSLRNELESTWFAVILDTSKVSLFRISNNIFSQVSTYPLTNGVQITVNNCTYGALLIVKNQDGSILVLRFSKDKENYYLYPIQNFESDVTHQAIWHGMNQLYLGIASHSSISIFTWFGDYFDLAQIINHGTEKLIPFYSKGFMYLAATGSTTLIFKYLLRSNEFVLAQRLPPSQDVSSFQLSESHFTEDFLSLSMESSTVIYKEIHDRFVPFQQIVSGKSTVPLISDKVILLLSLYEDTVQTYQYNGWRFVELDVKLSEILQFHRIVLHQKELLLMKYKNDTWALKELMWTRKKSYKDLQEEIKAWNIDAMKTTERTLQEIPDVKNPIRILRGHIKQLFVHNINEHNSQALKNISHEYKKVVSKLQERKYILSNKLHSNNLVLPSLHIKEIRINCKTKCKVNRLKVNGYPNFLSALEKMTDQNRIFNFKVVAVKEMKDWKCPLFSLPIENIIVDKSINGVLFDSLQMDALKVIGNQEVSGEHIFSSMDVINASILLDIASNLTKREIEAREVKVKEINLTEGGFLLPLDGPSTVITGSIRASKVKVKNEIFLRAKISGNWKKRVSPVTTISETISLGGDIILDDAKIENLKSKDLLANQAGSIKNILSKAIPLRDSMSVSLILSSDKIVWNNVTLHGPQNWITANSQDRVTIFGKKHISHNTKVLTSSYENLKFPKIELPLCGATIIVPKIKTTSLLVNNITVKSLNSTSVFGDLGEEYLTHNATFLFKPLDLSTERFYRNVTINNVSTIHMDNVDFPELKTLVNSWMKPNVFKTSIETTDLVINTLRLPARFRIDLPKVIGNIISEQTTYLNSINNVNFTDFLANAINLEDMVSLGNVTFGNDFTTDHIYVSRSPLTVTELKQNSNLHKKRIVGSIKTKAINMPKSFTFTENGAPFNIVVKGSAIFPSEPIIQSVNKIKLEELLIKIWMTTNMTVFHGKNLHLKNISIERNITLNNFSNVLNLEMWKNISKLVLSKTQSQEITVLALLNNVETPVIIGSNISNIKSTVSDFNDMFENALLKHKEQTVKAKWTFNKLKISGKLHTRKRINNMNIKTDVMRHNSEEIIVTGKKTVVVLATENLNGLNFDGWVNNALTQEKKISIIKGRKSFDNVIINGMNVSGTIMGHNMNKALLKSSNQTISGQKSVQGSIIASSLVVDGLINDVNLTTLMYDQLQKQKPVQRIKTKIELQNVLKIIGNLTINDSYGEAKLKNFYKNYSNTVSAVEEIKKYSTAAEIINTALRNQAIYISKFEVVKETDVDVASDKNIISQKEQCNPKTSSRFCVNENIENLMFNTNSTSFVLIKSISLDENEFIVWIKFYSVSIYVYNNVEKNLSRLQDLHFPKIIDAFVEPTVELDSLWIALQLTSQTVVLHYQPWKDLQEYVLPATGVFIMSRSPNNQLLLLLSDGIWNLEGLASPQQIIDIPLGETAETSVSGPAYYVKCTLKNNTTLMRARYVGN